MASTEFINGLNALTDDHLGCVATIGSFDGVHCGHQAVIEQVVQLAARDNLPSLVMLFEPQPQEFFSREKAPPRLMGLREKVDALFRHGVNRVLCLKFNHALRSLSAQAFIETVLVKGIGVKHLIIGDDFRFGCDRAGDFNLLKKTGESLGFTVTDTDTQTADGERISSTKIRKYLEADDLAAAAKLLGRPFSICRRVIYGNRLGRTIGFPTMNLGLGRYRPAVQGVYAVNIEIGGASYNGAANVGVKPTISGHRKPVLEVHVFDFNRDVYGKFVQVIFRKKIRSEMKFESVEHLKQQIAEDVTQIRAYFSY